MASWICGASNACISTDHIGFGSENSALGPMQFSAGAVFVRTIDNAVDEWALLDGTELRFGGRVLARSPRNVNRVSLPE